jgi:hypothetical protein
MAEMRADKCDITTPRPDDTWPSNTRKTVHVHYEPANLAPDNTPIGEVYFQRMGKIMHDLITSRFSPMAVKWTCRFSHPQSPYSLPSF